MNTPEETLKKRREAYQRWRLSHPGYHKQWQKSHKEDCKRYTERYLNKLPNKLEKFREDGKKFRTAHPNYHLTPERRAKQRIRSQKYKLKKYGLTRESFDALMASQNSLCAICSKEMFSPWAYPERRGKSAGPYSCACVDHDHNTGKVRSILCRNCNLGIGGLQDSSAISSLASAYLKHHGK